MGIQHITALAEELCLIAADPVFGCNLRVKVRNMNVIMRSCRRSGSERNEKTR